MMIGMLDSMMADAHYSSPNPMMEMYPGEFSPANQCNCDYRSPFASAANNEEQLGRDLAPAAAIALGFLTRRPTAAKSLGANPFKGKMANEAAKILEKKGFVPRGPDPAVGRGTYVNPKTGRGYHIDANHPDPKGPHVGVHRPRDQRDVLEPRDYPIGGP